MKIGLIGYGKMGQMIEGVAARFGMEVAERFMDVRPFRMKEINKEAISDISVLIDFSVPDTVLENIKICAELSKNLVVGTTGWYDHLDQAREIVKQSQIGLVYASNFSLGIHLFYQIVEYAGKLISRFEQYDPFIEEAHHKFKKDSPSGTALKLKRIMEQEYEHQTITVNSIRAGWIPGIHKIVFDSMIDTIVLEHIVRSREGFAEGAILAAKWIIGKKGFYEFKEVLDSMLKEKGQKLQI